MPKLLYVTCNQKSVDASRSLTVGKAFIDAYRQLHPDAAVETIDLYRHDMPRIDGDVLSAWRKMQGGQEDLLTEAERTKVERLVKHAGHFASFDRYVFATPMWNFGLPPEVKMFIDAICIAGQTFQYTSTGPVGLLTGKKCLHVHSSGGFHYGKPEDHSVPYLRTIMNFIGVPDFQAIVIEGVDAMPGKAEEYRQVAIEEARAVAAGF